MPSSSAPRKGGLSAAPLLGAVRSNPRAPPGGSPGRWRRAQVGDDQKRKGREEAMDGEEAVGTDWSLIESTGGSPCKQPPAALHPAEVGVGVPLPAPEVGVSAQEGAGNGDDSSDEASVAELGAKLFPSLPPDKAGAIWVDLVDNAKACIKRYNKNHQADFVYKHALDNGFVLVGEQNGSYYYHLNFLAQDKKGHSQVFFGEIKLCIAPKEEYVTCCLPVSPTDAGGRSIRTVEEARKHVFKNWYTVGTDEEHCYAFLPKLKHPEGKSYVAGHFADSRQYFMF